MNREEIESALKEFLTSHLRNSAPMAPPVAIRAHPRRTLKLRGITLTIDEVTVEHDPTSTR